MRLTKSQLREIIREEISKLKQPKMSTRLKELINKGWKLNEVEGTIENPKTGRKIKITTALSYPKDHPAYKAAKQSTQSISKSSTPKLSISKSSWEIKDGAGSESTLSYEAVNEFETIMNSTFGTDSGIADLDYDTGAILYYPSADSENAIAIGPQNGKYMVTAELETGGGVDAQEFDSPQEAVKFATKLAKKYKNKF